MKFSFIFPRALLKQFSPLVSFLFFFFSFFLSLFTLFNWILWLLNEATLSAVCHVYIIYIWWWYSMHICTEINVAKCQLWLNWKWTIKVQYWYWMCKRKKKENNHNFEPAKCFHFHFHFPYDFQRSILRLFLQSQPRNKVSFGSPGSVSVWGREWG